MNRRSTLFIFIFLLLASVLVSAIAVTVLWAKPNNPNKPDKPGKPVPEPQIADYKIWIGNGDLSSPEDVVLQPHGSPLIDYLLKDDWDWDSFWLPPPTEEKPTDGEWQVWLGEVNLGPDEEPTYAGTYDINVPSLVVALNLNGDFNIDDQDVFMLYITHANYKKPSGVENPDPFGADYWTVSIVWKAGTLEIPYPVGPGGENYHIYQLEGNTDMGHEAEGEYNENTDTWTILFDNAEFKLKENTSELDPETGFIVYNQLWEGPLSFTVEIQRILP